MITNVVDDLYFTLTYEATWLQLIDGVKEGTFSLCSTDSVLTYI